MAHAYFDCSAGAAGDMMVASLIDAGVDQTALIDAISHLKLDGYTIKIGSVTRGQMAATKFDVIVEHTHHHPHRHLSPILKMIDGANLPPRATERAKRVFTRLAEAEAKVHGTDIESVHFHEVGAVDSIIDIVGACIALELLDISKLYCSTITLGSGKVKCSHGIMPVPAPATAALVVGASVTAGDIPFEATTPTAAALLTTLTESYGPMPPMEITSVGSGAGTRDDGPVANILRVFVGTGTSIHPGDTAIELAANIDDCSGEIIGATINALLTSGAMDAWACPIVMKKSRPAWTLHALCAARDADDLSKLIFKETTTFGIRRHECRRTMLDRKWQSVETPYGPIRVKAGTMSDEIMTASPEFSDCRSAAQSHHVSIKEVYAAANAAYRQEEQ